MQERVSNFRVYGNMGEHDNVFTGSSEREICIDNLQSLVWQIGLIVRTMREKERNLKCVNHCKLSDSCRSTCAIHQGHEWSVHIIGQEGRVRHMNSYFYVGSVGSFYLVQPVFFGLSQYLIHIDGLETIKSLSLSYFISGIYELFVQLLVTWMKAQIYIIIDPRRAIISWNNLMH